MSHKYLLNMLPYFSVNNVAHMRGANIEKICNVACGQSTRGIGGSNGQNHFVCEFGHAVGLSFRWTVCSPSLGIHVSNIFRLGCHCEVIRVTAAWVIAFVENAQSRINRGAVMDYPSQPMGSHNRKLSSSATAIKNPVSKFVFSCFPRPALLHSFNLNFRPKSFLEFLGKNMRQERGSAFGCHT